jgi:hypothetical protein
MGWESRWHIFTKPNVIFWRPAAIDAAGRFCSALTSLEAADYLLAR